ncbi:unnamed protein product [Adineta steineri]|uniref:Transposase domain-containing protein n=1 Tax=Adineta steineri TaxID=433720 RepID=A0A815HJX6_9BILA|nr:unnamed protein product [Adineta steineri]
MNELELALEYAQKRKANRLKQNKHYRRTVRANRFSNLSISDSVDVEHSITNENSFINITLSNEEVLNKEDLNEQSLNEEDLNEEDLNGVNVPSISANSNDIFDHKDISDLDLHPYTNLGCFSFAKNLIRFIRKTNISKIHANYLIGLIQSALPQPNTLPITYSKMLTSLSGFTSKLGDQIRIKIYGIIGDTPALNMILNHKGHGGYDCCWFCEIKGFYINNKMQYYYDEHIALRTEINFATDSRNAQYSKQTTNGRHGVSILESIMDIPLPYSIIADYLHVTLLGHAKTICLYLYKNYMKPKARIELDGKISVQRFPHFFNRKIRPFNKSYLKATEIRNVFLFCILPMARNILGVEVMAHLGLFVIGIRLLHGRPVFGHQTADVANKLLIAFYRDHENFYKGLQNFVLHIHTHFSELYTNHEKRVPRPRTIYSPSDKSERPSHFLLHFDSTDSYTIALFSSINNITGNRATVNINGKKIFATIISSGDIFNFSIVFQLTNSTLLGTFESCENEQRKITRASQEANLDNNQLEASNYDTTTDINADPSSRQEGLIYTSSLNRQVVSHSKRPACFQVDAASILENILNILILASFLRLIMNAFMMDLK